MTTQYNTVPEYRQPLYKGTLIATPWYNCIFNLVFGKPPASESSVTVTASPFTFTAQRGGFLIVSGGTVSAISFMRSTAHATGVTAGCFPLSQNDQLIITYSGKPTCTFVPQ